MKRREFIGLLGSVAAAWPLAARAQQPAMPVVGMLRSTAAADSERLVAAFRQGLSDSGYTEGKNFVIDFRWAEGNRDRLRGLAADLVSRRVAVIVANNYATPAVMSVTKSIPIVFVSGDDPVTAGFVRHLNRPGGNVTGVSFFTGSVAPKRLEVLHDLLPRAESVALLHDPNYPGAEAELRELEGAARAIGQKLVVSKVENEREIDAAFSAATQAGISALLVGAGAFLSSRRRQLVRLAALHKIPTVYTLRHDVEAGGLMSYGASNTDAYRRAGVYVSRILKGEKPGDLPVELPTKFELVINLKTAKALGLNVPPTLLDRADEVIE
jgi:putative ABC transport system substrate-binding protein